MGDFEEPNEKKDKMVNLKQIFNKINSSETKKDEKN
jgi:hypothetical protein